MALYSFKDIYPLWSPADPLSVNQVAAWIAGFDPNSVDPSGDYFKNDETGLMDGDGVAWVHTARAALVNAVNTRKLKAPIRRTAWERGWDEQPKVDQPFTKQVAILPNDAAEAWNVAEPHSVRGHQKTARRPSFALILKRSRCFANGAPTGRRCCAGAPSTRRSNRTSPSIESWCRVSR
jgi:hypothetical protein